MLCGAEAECVAALFAGIPESNAEYVEAARIKETWTVRDVEGQAVGVTLVDRHFPWVAETHLTVVKRSAHGTGVGTAMLAARGAPASVTSTRSLGSGPLRRPASGERVHHA